MPLRSLIDWFDTNRRDLPWRRTRDPYAIWVSEVMLQQTQVATVIPYFERWMARFPTVGILALADEQEALSLWQGLGYYRRCRLLFAGAKHVVENGMPDTAREWAKVPSVGRYTAGAIASIAFGEAVPLVDGNVERVYARFAEDRASGPSLHKNAWAWAESVLDRERPGDWNQALMELGATICRPVAPDCPRCPLKEECLAQRHGTQNELPTAEKKRETVALRHLIWVPTFEGRFGVRQIPEGQWWQGMWEFPRGEHELGLRDLVGPGWVEDLGSFRHSVTHHRITVYVSRVHCEAPSPALRWCSRSEIEELPMPAPQRKALALAQGGVGGQGTEESRETAYPPQSLTPLTP